MLNKCFFMGRLVADPEVRKTTNDQSVCNFTLAVERDFKNADGTHDADFIDFVAWRNTAEFICKYFTKGRMMVVDGRMQIRKWTGQDGTGRRSSEIVVDNAYFGDSAKTGDVAGTPQQATAHSTPSAGATSTPPAAPTAPVVEDNEEDWPF